MTTKRLTNYETEILSLVYEKRAITLEQLARLLNRTMNGIYCKVNRLQKDGLLETESVTKVKGYGEVHKQGKYVYVTDKGIAALKGIDYNFKGAPRRAKRNKPSRGQVPFTILSNEISFEVNDNQWEFFDGRNTKKLLNRRTNELLNAMLRSKETKEMYGIYITLPIQTVDKTPSEKYTGMLSKELKMHYEQMSLNEKGSNLNQYIFFCKDIEWYEHLINHIPKIQDGAFLSRVRSIRIVPFETGKYLLKTMATPTVQKTFQKHLTEIALASERSFEIDFEITKREEQLGFDFKINLDGETFYVANLLDMDLKKLHRLKRYTEFEYERNGKTKLILFSTDFNTEIIRAAIKFPYSQVMPIELYKLIELLGKYE